MSNALKNHDTYCLFPQESLKISLAAPCHCKFTSSCLVGGGGGVSDQVKRSLVLRIFMEMQKKRQRVMYPTISGTNGR